MKLENRIKRYQAIEQRRGRPLVVYATSTRQNVGGYMASDAIREFIDQMDSIPPDHKAIDVLIHSTGGDALTAWKVMALLRGRFDQVGVLVPFSAFSAATILALGADEIVMHPHASLGPIDPQIQATMGNGKPIQFAYEDVGAFLRFVSEEVGLTEQVYVTGIIDKLFATVNPLHIGAAKRASDLSTDVGARLLAMHMTSPEDKRQAREVAENLNKSFFSHSDAISRSRARELRLRIANDDVELERQLWEAFLGLESYLELRKPFFPLEHFLHDPSAAKSIEPPPLVQLPANAPNEIARQVWEHVAKGAVQSLAPAKEVPFSHINAVIESPRAASEYRSEGVISAVRLGLNLQVSVTPRQAGWQSILGQGCSA